MRFIFHTVVVSLFLIFFADAVFAQQTHKITTVTTPLKKRDLKVGLVLSGGGAKGFSYIGVLKMIDALGIKIDYIAGTSIGAVLGSLYAAGYTGVQIEKILNDLGDLDKMAMDTNPRSYKSFFERSDNAFYAFSLNFDGLSPRLPRAISKGQKLYNMLSEKLASVDIITNFRKLPVPFFCVATHLATGQKVVMEKGYLPDAVRASAALPTLMEPIVINGESYIDGGLVDNFPVVEMRKRGVDIIIGVDSQSGLKSVSELKDMVNMLNQIISYRLVENNVIQKRFVDIYIQPDVRKFGVTAFNEKYKLIREGEKAAIRSRDKLVKIADAQGNFSPTKKTIKIPLVRKLDSITFSPLKHYSPSYLLNKLQVKKSMPISYQNLSKKINVLSEMGNFNLIRYRWKRSPKKTNYLDVNIQEYPYQTKLKLGVYYDPIYKSSLLANFSITHFLQKNDFFSLRVMLGDLARYRLRYFVDSSYGLSYGIESNFDWFNRLRPYDEENSVIQRISKNLFIFDNKAYFQFDYQNKFNLTFGGFHKFFYETTNAFIKEFDEEKAKNIFKNIHYFGTSATFDIDTYDRVYMPKSGLKLSAEFSTYLLSNTGTSIEDLKKIEFDLFNQLNVFIGYAYTIGKTTFDFQSQLGMNISDGTSKFLYYNIGGYSHYNITNYIPFYGMPFEAKQVLDFYKFFLATHFEIFHNHQITLATNFIKANNFPILNGGLDNYLNIGIALGYTYHSIVGPISLKVGFSGEHIPAGFFSIGAKF